MKKTLSQRFFLPLCLLTLFGILGGSHAWAEELTIDFESASTSYTDWTFTNMTSQVTGSITAKGGTYYGTTGGKASASITTKTAIPYPTSISFYVSKQSSNTKSSNWKIQVSSNNSTWTDVKTQSATSMSKGTWVEVTQDLSSYDHVYVRIYYTGSTAVRNIDDVTLTYSTSVAPTLSVSKTEISFSDVEKLTSENSSFTFKALGLSDAATFVLSGTNADMFSVSPSSITPIDGSISDTEVTVTYTPTEAGSHEATLTVSSTGATDQVIALSGTAIAPLPHYTVNWMVNGNPYSEGTPSTDVAEGESVETLPTTPAAIGDKVFMGWTNATIEGTQDDEPAVLFTSAAEAPAVTANTTYYAVFADATPGSSSWNRIKNLADVTDGSYVIKNDAYVLPSTTKSSSPSAMAAPTITDDVITGTVEESMIWNFTSTGTVNQFYVKNEEGSYLYAIKDGAGVRVGTTSDKWTFAVNTTDYFSMQEANNSRYCAKYKSGTDWRSYTDANHANYANGGKLELYKLVTAYTYSAYATNFATLSNRNLAFSEPAVDYFEAPFTAPILNGHTEGVTYASSDTEVATVNATTGEITIGTKYGTTTITASAEQSGSYYADEASYTISVWPNSISGLKTLITSESEIDFKVKLNNAVITYADEKNAYLQDADAAILIFVYGHGLTAGKSYTGVASGKAKLFKGLREITSIDWGTITPEVVSVPAAQVVTVAELNADYDKYESMYVTVQNAIVSSALSSRNATISQDSEEYAVYDKNNGLEGTALSTTNAIANVVGFPGKFNTTLQLNVFNDIDVEETGYNLAVSAAGYATYFNSANAFTMPADATGYVWFEGKIKKAYNHSEDVPANEPLVIEAAAGNYPLWFTTSTKTSWKNDSMNDLEGTDFEADHTDDANYYFYGLSLNASHDPASVGFYWMNATGAAFTNGAHKAYLKLDKNTFVGSQAVNGFPFNGSTTGIEQIEAGADAKNAIYDLSGRRVNKAAKGIYILNGKKVLVK